MSQLLIPFQMATPMVSASKPGTKKRKRVNRACVACQRSHMSCDAGRPCKRCVERGMGHLCKDGIRKQRGRKRKGRQGLPNAIDSIPTDGLFQEDEFDDIDEEDDEEIAEGFDLALLEPEVVFSQIPKRPVGRPRKIRKDREVTNSDHVSYGQEHSGHHHGQHDKLSSSTSATDSHLRWDATSSSPVDSGLEEDSSVDIESTSLEWDSEDGASTASSSTAASTVDFGDILRSSDPFTLYNSLEETLRNYDPSAPLSWSLETDDIAAEKPLGLTMPHYTMLDCFL